MYVFYVFCLIYTIVLLLVFVLLSLVYFTNDSLVFTACRKARFASAIYATTNPFVRPSVRLTPVLCQNEGTQRYAVFTIG